jgi:hypothetical protein
VRANEVVLEDLRELVFARLARKVAVVGGDEQQRVGERKAWVLCLQPRGAVEAAARAPEVEQAEDEALVPEDARVDDGLRDVVQPELDVGVLAAGWGRGVGGAEGGGWGRVGRG